VYGHYIGKMLLSLSLEIGQLRHRFDQHFTHRQSTYAVELRSVWSVPGTRCSLRYSQIAVCLRFGGLQIRHRAVPAHGLCTLLWTGGLRSP